MKKIYSLAFLAFAASASFGQVVISQVYGGGGNSGSVYTHDFVELFNKGTETITLSGASLQYGSATNVFQQSNVQILDDITIQPGKYYLIQEAQGANGTTALPTPDLVPATPLALGSTNGKIALVSNIELISGASDTDVIDFVGFGTANEYEGTAAVAALSNANSAQRKLEGCQDTNDNAADFDVSAAAPRNSQTATHLCEDMAIGDVTANTIAFTTLWTNTVKFSSKGQSTVQVYNLNGAVVKTFKGNGDFTANVSDLANGSYIVKVTSDKGVSTVKKVIKK